MSLLIGRDTAHLYTTPHWDIEDARAWAIDHATRHPDQAGPLRALVRALDEAEARAWDRRRQAAAHPELNLGATR